MSRYPEGDDYDDYWMLHMGRWQKNIRAVVKSNSGRKILQELKEALEAMPIRELIADSLVETSFIGLNLQDEGQEMIPVQSYCAIGALAARRGINVEEFANGDPDYHEMTTDLAAKLGINLTLAYSIATCNDEASVRIYGSYRRPKITPAQRWQYVYDRVCKSLEEGVPLAF